jgi:hypothetical protein
MRFRGVLTGLATAMALALSVQASAAQSLADYDYTNLKFRGLGVEWGDLWPTRVDATQSIGVRADLGYLGPGVRIVPSITYWSSHLKQGEVTKLANRMADFMVTQGQLRPTLDLGQIKWSDVQFTVDAQGVWRVPFGILSYVGAGVSIHVLRGSGAAIDGTFVQDLLDEVTAGLDAHGGLEYPVADRVRVFGQARYEILSHLRYAQIRLGAQVMFGQPAPGEERR